MYLMISGDPSTIEMNEVKFEGNGNTAYKAGNTLYVVWKSTSNMISDQFSSFVNASEDAKVETSKGEIIRLGEFVSSGESSEEEEEEGKNGYKVCAQIEMRNNTGKVVVIVMDEEEESGGEGCVVGMEGGEVSGERSMGEVNGEGVVVDMGSELTQMMQECEDIEIVMNVSYSLSTG